MQPGPALGYRKRARLRSNGRDLGFVNSKTKRLAPIAQCVVLDPVLQKRLKHLRDALHTKSDPTLMGFYDLTLRDTFAENAHPGLSELRMRKNQPSPFEQACEVANLAMQDTVCEMAEQDNLGNAGTLELFCGSGNFTKRLSQHKDVESLVAIDVDNASTNMLSLKSLTKTSVHCVDLLAVKFDWNTFEENLKNCVVRRLILDPPRRGYEHLAELTERFPSIESIIYISCHAKSFAKDIKDLTQQGWEVVETVLIDNFRQTRHYETLSRLQRNSLTINAK